MCRKKPYPRCSSHARERLETAVLSGDEQKIKQAKIDYYTSPAGIKLLEESGKDKLAEKFRTRRATKIAIAEKQERIEKQITVALDLDNTTADFDGAFRGHLAKKYNLTPEEALKKYPPTHDYSFVVSGWFKDRAEFVSEFQEAERDGIYKNMPIYRGARKVFRSLQDKGYTLKVVTARTPEYKDDTKVALRRYKLPYRELTHTEEKEKENAHLFFDDSPKQITTLTAHGKKVVTFNALCNQGITGVGRVNDWTEVEAAVARHAR